MDEYSDSDESPIVTDEDLLDIDDLTPKESCIWLLEKLNWRRYIERPYCIPFVNYVLTWSKAVPITAIIMAQSPYPNNIFPEIAAAMSFDTELCMKSRIGRPSPPTVEVLANDMFVNEIMKKEDLTVVIQNGWCLVEKGVLLVNEAVFEKSGSPDADVESVSQQWVIRRLLMETEKYGNRTVDVYGLGEAGHRMMNGLSSNFKSATVKLSKHKATHPAGIARRHEDLNAPSCNLGTPAFSKSLGRHLSNYVAFAHTMANQRKKKSQVELQIQKNADLVSIIAEQLEPLAERVEEVMANTEKFNKALKDGQFDNLVPITDKLTKSFQKLYARVVCVSGAFNAVNVETTGGAAYTSKAGPSRSTVQPSATALIEHTGGSISSAPTNNIKRIPIAGSRRSSVASVTSTVDNTSPTIDSDTKPVIRKKIIRPGNVNRAVSNPVAAIPSTDSEPAFTKRPLTVQPRVGASLRQSKLTGIEELKETKSPVTKKLSPEHIAALSSIPALVEAHSADSEDDDVIQELENIQNDMKEKTIYNFSVERLVEAIDKDIAAYKNKNEKFNLYTWVLSPGGESFTYDLCAELFHFN